MRTVYSIHVTVTHQCVIIREPRRIREEEVRRGEQRGEKEGWRGRYTDSHNRDCNEYDTSGVCGAQPPKHS